MGIEKYKNTITWKDDTVTGICVGLLTALLFLSMVIPTRFVFGFFVGLTFYIGYQFGIAKRAHRAAFLKELATWATSLCGQQQPAPVILRSRDSCNVLEELGITRLRLRDWINSKFRTQLSLRTVDACVTMQELADLTVFASPCFDKSPRRYRSWHSDFYNNFLDHVPTDATDHDAGSICHRMQAGASLPEI